MKLVVIKIVVNSMSYFFFFFFQAEDGIRDLTVTGVQTCALPIFGCVSLASSPSPPTSVSRQQAARSRGELRRSRRLSHSQPIAPARSPCPVKIGRASCRERV